MQKGQTNKIDFNSVGIFSVQRLHGFRQVVTHVHRSKRWIEIVQGCQLSIATKVLVMDLYAVQYAIPARKPKTQTTHKNKKANQTNKDKQQKASNQQNPKKWDRYQ